MTPAEEELIHETGEWQMTMTGAPEYVEGNFYSIGVKWMFVFNNEILN